MQHWQRSSRALKWWATLRLKGRRSSRRAPSATPPPSAAAAATHPSVRSCELCCSGQPSAANRPQGAFEVEWCLQGSSTSLWSKLETGEPSTLGAATALAQLLARDLRPLLPRPAADEGGAGSSSSSGRGA